MCRNRMVRTGFSSWKNRFYALISVVCFAVSAPLLAKPEGNSGQLIEYLAQEKNNLTLVLNESRLPSNPSNETEYKQLIEQNDALIALNKAKIASYENFLVNQTKLQDDFTQRLKQLQQFPGAELSPMDAQQKIEKINTLNDINKKTISLLNDNIELAKRYQQLLLSRQQALFLWKSKEQLRAKLDALHARETRLNDNLLRLYDKSIDLQQQIKSEGEFRNNYALEARLLLNNQLINLTQYKMAELHLQRKLAKAEFLLKKNPDIRTLQSVAETYKTTMTQLSDMEQSLRKMRTMVKNEQSHVGEKALQKSFTALTGIINDRIASIGIQEQTLQEDLDNHQEELKKQLSVRQSLSEYRLDSWPDILSQISKIPSQVYGYLKILTLKIRDNYQWLDTLPMVLLWMALIFITVTTTVLYRLLKQRSRDKERSRLTGHLYEGTLTLFNRNLPLLGVTGAFLCLFYFNHIPFANYQMLMQLSLVGLAFSTLIQIARLVLLERVTDSSGTDVRLYHRLKWLLLAGGWTTALMVISYLLPLTTLLQDIFNRLFMLFLVAVSILSWKNRHIITHLLHPVLKSKKRYFRHAVMLLVILIPLTLLAIAVIGMVGYINLAWTLSRYQMQLLLLLSAYVLMRGLLFDAMELLSEWMISTMTNGWLWIEVWLKPLDKVLRVGLLAASIYVVFQLFGWHSDSLVMVKLVQFGHYPLINMAGIHITAFSILNFLILLSVFMWAAKWTREFSYRWLYRDARDPGIRNSLSVFTQYAVILIGGFVTLRALGFDFSGMSMVIGGLAVGMGFGLRDFASNVVGGLMLLIERPVREGDLITLGNYEGRVAHIGIRSMRVSSWDNMEVLIPNAETFNKPFTNWTHQDGIVRTVTPIKVSRADDPVMIQQLILDVLAIIPEIVADPPAQAFLKQIDEALIEFEVRYFINVQLHTRFEIRSKVLFAIAAQFKAAGIKPPIPPISVEIKEGEHEALFIK
ncbi:mechanosensitive ion channel [Legionella sp. MW5194]|nr:mechanosensitive ion channel [Legionella sp. MW5194]